MTDSRLEGAVVGQDQQSFAVGVQATGGIHTRHGNEIGEGLPALDRAKLGQHAEGFVEQDDAGHERPSGPGTAIEVAEALGLRVGIEILHHALEDGLLSLLPEGGIEEVGMEFH